MKKLLALLLAMLMLLSVLASCGEDSADGDSTTPADTTTTPPAGTPGPGDPENPDDPEDPEDPNDPSESFVPVMRFIVASDTHLKDAGDVEDQNFAKLFETAYNYSDNHALYTKIDGIFVVGDCVDKGTQEQMERFFTIADSGVREGTLFLASLGNHEYYTTKTMSELSGTQVYDKTVEWFLEASGQEAVDTHITINGYHFIMLSPDGTGWDFSAAKQEWLTKELQKAAADDPTGKKPIFVFQHESVTDTVIGGCVTSIRNILNKYPQVVDFSGHSHYPNNDPRSVHQKFFTSLGTGSMKYYSFDFAGVTLPDVPNASDYEGNWAYLTDATVLKDGGQYYIVEMDANEKLRVQAYDVVGEDFSMEPLFIEVGDTSKFTYTEDRKETSEAPYFTEGTQISVDECDFSYLELTFPQAVCKDMVNHYRVELYEDNNLITSKLILSGTAYTPVPPTRTVKLSGLKSATAYEVKVVAVSAWAKESEPLVLNVTTKTLSTTVTQLPEADLFAMELKATGLPTDTVSKAPLVPSSAGTPTVEYNEELGRYVAIFDNKSNYLFEGITSKYEAIRDSVTFEVLFRADTINGDDCVVSNQQAGGLGLNIHSGGKIDFTIHLNGAYQSVAGTFSEGQFVHAVGVYDGSTVKLYLNGSLVDEVSASGLMGLPNANSQYLCIGADSQPSKLGDAPFTGAIAVANIYDDALSADQIVALYLDYIG